MFTHLASYFLGAVAKEDTAPTNSSPTAETRLHEVEDDDWLLVDKSDVQDENEALPLERRSSTSSLPNLGMEESWFVTPPPCFTSAGPITLETSPLENLLIEHPSMSVYHHSLSPPHHYLHHQQLRNRSRSVSVSSTTRTPSPQQPARGDQPAQPLQPLQPNNNNNRRQAPAVYHHNSTDLVSQLKSAQKQQQRKLCQLLKRNQMERSNKAREFGSRNKQQRRADRQNNHSGANNNRKSC